MALKLLCTIFLTFLRFAPGELFLNTDHRNCIDLCSSCNGTVSFAKGFCECNIKDSMDKDGEYISRLKREAKSRGLNYVSCKNEKKNTRCTLLNRFLTPEDAPIVAQYFKNNGPYQLNDDSFNSPGGRTVFIAPPYTDTRNSKGALKSILTAKSLKNVAEDDEVLKKNEPPVENDEVVGASRKLIVQPKETMSKSKSKAPKKVAPKPYNHNSEAPCDTDDNVVGDAQIITQPEETIREPKRKKTSAPKKSDRPPPSCELEDSIVGDSPKEEETTSEPESEEVKNDTCESDDKVENPKSEEEEEKLTKTRPPSSKKPGRRRNPKLKKKEEVAEAKPDVEAPEDQVVGSSQNSTQSEDKSQSSLEEDVSVSKPQQQNCTNDPVVGIETQKPMKFDISNPIQLVNILNSKPRETTIDFSKIFESDLLAKLIKFIQAMSNSNEPIKQPSSNKNSSSVSDKTEKLKDTKQNDDDNNYNEYIVGAQNPNSGECPSDDSTEIPAKSDKTSENSEGDCRSASVNNLPKKQANSNPEKCTLLTPANSFYSPVAMVQNPFLSRFPQINDYVPGAYVLGPFGTQYFPKQLYKRSLKPHYPLQIMNKYKRSTELNSKEKQHSSKIIN